MGESFSSVQPSERASEGRLDSWKEIAAYLKRDVTTVQRWEKREGMPVHRHVHDKRGSVYALGSELDTWQQNRGARLEEDEAVQAEAAASGATESGRGPRRVRFRWLVLAAVAVVCLTAIAYVVLRGRARETSRPKIRSLAVLPLKNLSGDSSQDYLADGMTDAIIGRLAGIHDLRVVSYTSVMRFKDPKMSVPDISKTLGVDALVEGSVIREGNRIRVTAQLIRGATDDHFWSETYDRDVQDVLAMQSEIAQAIAEKVQVTMTGEEQQRLTAARPVAPEVYESYLKGTSAGNLDSRASIEEAKADFEDAIKKDPTFAPAYVGLANAYMGLGSVFAGGSPEQTRPLAMSAARKALELDPNLPEAHVILANVLQKEWQWAEAGAEYRRALDLNPNDGVAHGAYATWLLCQGRTDEAIAWVKRGRELDPFAVSGADVGWILFQSHRYDEALRELRSVLAVNPDDVDALWFLGFVLAANNQAKDAIPPLEKALSLSNRSPGVIGVLVRAYAHAGRRPDALRLLEELKERNKKGYVPAAAFVNAYLGLGENEEALVWLGQAYKEKSSILQFVKVHPYFDPIRNDPRFVDLVKRIGLG
jgi:TolB-like protein/Tfp pilus assembly protein PilF